MKLPTAPPAFVATPLIDIVGVGKDYPVLETTGARLGTVFNLLTGRAIKRYHRALHDISLQIPRGESWGVIGENGAGKSTLMKIIAGVVVPTSGTLTIQGRVSALLELGTGFHQEYSGRENIFLATSLLGWSRAETNAKLEGILAFADIGTQIEQPVKTYSSGMVVRLGFAIVTALRPDLLVTDEVLAVGDESFQKKCMQWMEDYRAGGGTLLLCSHSMYHIQSLCQKAIWIHHGECRMKGNSYDVSQAYLAYHEEKNRTQQAARIARDFQSIYPCLEKLTLYDGSSMPRKQFTLGETIILEGQFHSPDDRPTVLMAGIVRIDGTPVFGTFSSDQRFEATRVGERHFAFRFIIHHSPLLPGKYQFRAHTMDEHGLRLFDTMETEFIVNGETREHGFVRLNYSWEPAPIVVQA